MELWNGGGESDGGGMFGVGETGGIFGEGVVNLECFKSFLKWCNLFSEIIWNSFTFLNLLDKNLKEENIVFEKEWKN